MLSAPPPRTIAGLVLAWAIVWFVLMALGGGSSWHFFVQGAAALVDVDDAVTGGLHLYAAAPVLQIGPLTFLAIVPLLPAGPLAALIGWQVLGAVAGLLILWLVRGLVPSWQRDAGWLALGAAYFLPVWMFLAVGVAHLDDVLALLLSVGALRAARAGRTWLTGLLLGLAVDAKPWAVGFAAMLLLLRGWRRQVCAAVALTVAVAVAWLPFFVADPGTSAALHYTIKNNSVSALHALGIHNPRTPPWDRPAQLALALILGVIAVRRGRWAAIPLLAVASRLVLEPGGNKYYIAGVVVGTVIWDFAGSRHDMPWWTLAACLSLFTARWIPMPDAVHGWLLVGLFLAAGSILLGAPRPVPESPWSLQTQSSTVPVR
ncbi:glycosyltransferase 87 family protein [Dactylosporangium sp. McL0621]|uniref:glycosyltransferase 87 family protein n=1 Tax=Dactylosporangium sp. McL0621 TaxID=3415678 RepID=UPI003CEA68CA